MSDKGAAAETFGKEHAHELVVDDQAHQVFTLDGDGVVVGSRSMNIVERMALVMRDVEHVGKSGQNREQHYNFRPIDEFMNALHTPLVRHEVVVTPTVIDRQSFERDRRNRQGEIVGVTRVCELLMRFTFHAPDGSTLEAVTAGEGADVADKATNKAMAAALKYAIMQTFMVPTRELHDGDADTPEIPSGSREQHAQSAAAAATGDALAQKASELGRDAIMHMLDEAVDVLGKSRAELTKKWRDVNSVGAVKNLDDEDKVPTTELYRFVLTLAPYVQQARERITREAEQTQQGGTTVNLDDTEQQARAAATGALCPERSVKDDGSELVCTRAADHDGEHQWWG